LANPNPSPKGQIKKGEVRNPHGYSPYRNAQGDTRTKIESIRNLCLVDVEKIIERWRMFALTEEPKYAFQYGKDLMDRGLGKAIQTAVIKNDTGQPMSMQAAYDALNNTIVIQEERNSLRQEVEELKKQIKLLSEKKGSKKKDDDVVVIENGEIIHRGIK
jgi:polyhydroxyalkanoate synthesis regulator phasin